ncbi:galactoside O-acetyltransferase [Idiomarina piscisalsi]|uniref:Galactoside O-acetyltransferase n=1 Tax=Idiomarina piscisalsi TaxID=1096243 RepID=A0ABM6LVC5_9GAMM|nr:acyltransferase [Idiomarina piscisalsi]ASG66427.1 galactoside O-acetyltransferase [Idiomarina piscisalsi]
MRKATKKIMVRIVRVLYLATRNWDYDYMQTLRPNLIRFLGAIVGSNVKIKSGVLIEYPDKLIIGNNVSLQHNCFLSAYGQLEIGSNVSIAHGVSILTSTHKYDSDEIIRNNKLIKSPVKIGNNVWIGMKASILSGVTIGDGCVVGAHSLVTRSFNENTVIAGIPAKLIKERL